MMVFPSAVPDPPDATNDVPQVIAKSLCHQNVLFGEETQWARGIFMVLGTYEKVRNGRIMVEIRGKHFSCTACCVEPMVPRPRVDAILLSDQRPSRHVAHAAVHASHLADCDLMFTSIRLHTCIHTHIHIQSQ